LVEDSYHKDRIANRRLHPETLMMGYGYAPGLSEGSLKPPIFLTSTFVFENAQQGKDFFDLTSGRRQPRPGEKSGLVYSRFNNPNLEILEDRLAIWDQAPLPVRGPRHAAERSGLHVSLRQGWEGDRLPQLPQQWP
jgi:methionine-gamma-lyase